MPTNKAPCPVCAENVRTDFLPNHIAKHTDLVVHAMTEEHRKWCVEKRTPLFFSKTGPSYNFCVCLVCKKGKTILNNGSVEAFMGSHKYDKTCSAAFDSVKQFYGLDDAAVLVTNPIEYMSKPSNHIMEVLYHTFGLSDTDKLLPIDEQLMKVVMSHQRLESLYQRRQVNEAKQTITVEEENRICELERVALLEQRRKEEREHAERLYPTDLFPAQNVVTMLIVSEEPKETPKVEEVPKETPKVEEVPTVEHVKKPIRKVTTTKALESLAPESITIIVSPEPKRVIKKCKTTPSLPTLPLPPSPPSSSLPPPSFISKESDLMINKLAGHITYIYDLDICEDDAEEKFAEDNEELNNYFDTCDEQHIAVQDLKDAYDAWLWGNISTKEMKQRADDIMCSV